ncbi:MAG: VOC family protein [Magnetococcales bacterium]|nr:VOC family protein [Magnetococcales bacterium]
MHRVRHLFGHPAQRVPSGQLTSEETCTEPAKSATSLLVHCEDQSEIDHFWNGLAADPEAGRCGWIKDPYGLSWQIVPVQLDALLRGPPERRDRVTQAFLKMKKFDLAALMRAAESE